MPWWGIVLIAVASFIIGGIIVYVATMLYISRGFRDFW